MDITIQKGDTPSLSGPAMTGIFAWQQLGFASFSVLASCIVHQGPLLLISRLNGRSDPDSEVSIGTALQTQTEGDFKGALRHPTFQWPFSRSPCRTNHFCRLFVKHPRSWMDDATRSGAHHRTTTTGICLRSFSGCDTQAARSAISSGLSFLVLEQLFYRVCGIHSP